MHVCCWVLPTSVFCFLWSQNGVQQASTSMMKQGCAEAVAMASSSPVRAASAVCCVALGRLHELLKLYL
jgi:hypothetical protein